MDLEKVYDLEKITRFHSEVNGEKFWFDAKEEMITPLFQEQLFNWDKDPRACAEAFSEILTDWDIEKAGKKVGLDVESLMRIPKKFHNHCLDVIIKSWQGDPPKPSESSST